MVLHGCWSSSHRVCISYSRKGTRVCLTSGPNTALHLHLIGQDLLLYRQESKELEFNWTQYPWVLTTGEGNIGYWELFTSLCHLDLCLDAFSSPFFPTQNLSKIAVCSARIP